MTGVKNCPTTLQSTVVCLLALYDEILTHMVSFKQWFVSYSRKREGKKERRDDKRVMVNQTLNQCVCIDSIKIESLLKAAPHISE